MKREWVVGVILCGAVFVVGAMHREAKPPAVHADGGIPEDQIKHRCAMCVNCCHKCQTEDRCCCWTSDRCTCPPKDPTLR